MISNQVIQNSIDELRAITKVDLGVFDVEGLKVAATVDEIDISRDIIENFASSPADSQVVGGRHLLKILDDGEPAYILVAQGPSDDVYMVGKIAVSSIQNLIIAYKERFDRNNFFQNLLLDNLLLVDIYNRAQKLHIEVECPRIVYLIETKIEKDNSAMEMLKSLFSSQNGDYITAVDERNIILIKALEKEDDVETIEKTADMIVDMMNSEAMMNVRVAYGTVVGELREVSKSYKEATMAMDVGKIFYAEKSVISYAKLGIGRLIDPYMECAVKEFIPEGQDYPENTQEINVLLTELRTYMDNFMAESVMNGIDDTKWQKHLEDCKKFKYEKYTELNQEYYDRMMKLAEE